VVTLEGDAFDAEELLRTVARHRPQTMAIVGDSFARPILNALEASPGKYDVSSLAMIISSGVMWSLEVKRGMLEHMPQAMLNDGFSSSEAIGMGASIMTKAGEVQTAKFMVGDRCRVFDEDDKPVEPGSGRSGIVALGPPNPLGYYKDDEKTAKTFRMIGGVRYSIPGDWCVVEADGSLTLLGRGSACINTAGEKVFPEEVEEALKTAAAIAALSLPAVMIAKESVNRAYETTLAEGVRFERRVFHSLFATEDQKEGMGAFVEKRAPAFKRR